MVHIDGAHPFGDWNRWWVNGEPLNTTAPRHREQHISGNETVCALRGRKTAWNCISAKSQSLLSSTLGILYGEGRESKKTLASCALSDMALCCCAIHWYFSCRGRAWRCVTQMLLSLWTETCEWSCQCCCSVRENNAEMMLHQETY